MKRLSLPFFVPASREGEFLAANFLRIRKEVGPPATVAPVSGKTFEKKFASGE
jgi:hypothetical protein